MNLYVGTSGYSYPKWKGKFYPRDLPAGRMLRYYGEHFQTVEANSTFRAMPSPSAVEAWTADVPTGFRFALKAPQRITHIKRLKNVEEAVGELFAVAAVLKNRLGPVLFQLPPNFKKDVPRLQELLAQLPPRRKVAFEFRHPSWFDDEVYRLLRRRRAALCIADTDKLTVPFVPTTNWGYLRLRRPAYNDAALKKWLKLVGQQNWRDVFVFFKHEDEARGPVLAMQLLKLAGASP
jgi:uncharacterized protein YecE (DUF72 family)